MIDVERLLQDTLQSHLATVEAPRVVPAAVLRRAKRGRILMATITAAASIAVVAGASLGAVSLKSERPPESASGGLAIQPGPPQIRANGAITYSASGRDGLVLHAIEPDGTNDRVIPTPEGHAWHSAWSPDGQQIAVTIFPQGDGKRALWVMNGDGSDPRKVAEADNVSAASWSPDGRWIAYSARDEGETSIKAVHPDGTGHTEIHAEAAEGTFAIFSVQFSPDGTKFVFDRGTDAGFDIFTMNVDGSNVQRLTTTGTDYDPYWSPDGTKIVFTREDSSKADADTVATSDIFVMSADGSGVRRLTTSDPRHGSRSPIWSPDGTAIAYVAGDGGPLVVMEPDGSNARTLVSGDVLGIGWQPTELPASDDKGLVVAAYLYDDATAEQRRDVRATARTIRGVIRVQYVSKRKAYREFKEHYREEPEYWENLPKNALPARFDITCDSEACVSRVISRMHDHPAVDEARRQETSPNGDKT